MEHPFRPLAAAIAVLFAGAATTQGSPTQLDDDVVRAAKIATTPAAASLDDAVRWRQHQVLKAAVHPRRS